MFIMSYIDKDMATLLELLALLPVEKKVKMLRRVQTQLARIIN